MARSHLRSRQVVLMSIRPVYAERILRGEKHFEIRRRGVKLEPGALVLVYASAPVKAIVGAFTVRAVHVRPVADIWTAFAPRLGISHDAYVDYLHGAEQACAIEVDHCVRLQHVQLADLREREEGFRPPQSYMFIDNERSPGLRSITDTALRRTAPRPRASA